MNGFTIYLGSSLYIECVDGMTMGSRGHETKREIRDNS